MVVNIFQSNYLGAEAGRSLSVQETSAQNIESSEGRKGDSIPETHSVSNVLFSGQNFLLIGPGQFS